jgi:D-aminopeptidase
MPAQRREMARIPVSAPTARLQFRALHCSHAYTNSTQLTCCAIRGARKGGAADILVNDSHGSMRNLRPEDMENGVRLISHSFKRSGMMEGLDESFDAALFIGYHAKAGSPQGLFAHTGSGVVADVRVNGRSLGEGGLNTTVAAWYGVPVVLVTGDDAAIREIGEIAPGAKKVAVKRAINPRAVELRPLDEVHRDIQTAAREGVATAQRIQPRREPHYDVEVQFRDPESSRMTGVCVQAQKARGVVAENVGLLLPCQEVRRQDGLDARTELVLEVGSEHDPLAEPGIHEAAQMAIVARPGCHDWRLQRTGLHVQVGMRVHEGDHGVELRPGRVHHEEPKTPVPQQHVFEPERIAGGHPE